MSRNLDPNDATPLDAPLARFRGVELLAGMEGPAAGRLSFDIAPGSLSVLHGPSGCGKSVAIDLLSFEGGPARGVVEIFGVDGRRVHPDERAPYRRRIGVVFQDRRLLADLSAFDNVALAAVAAERTADDYVPKVSELLTWVGLAGRAGEEPGHLSESERRRLCLARALINGPDLLLADEPTEGLSDKSAERLIRLLADAHRAGATVVVATRDLDIAKAIGATVISLAQGAAS